MTETETEPEPSFDLPPTTASRALDLGLALITSACGAHVLQASEGGVDGLDVLPLERGLANAHLLRGPRGAARIDAGWARRQPSSGRLGLRGGPRGAGRRPPLLRGGRYGGLRPHGQAGLR